MNESEMQVAILTSLYHAWNRDRSADMHQVREGGRWDKTPFQNVLDRMARNERLIQPYSGASHYKITSLGVLKAEELALGPQEEIESNRQTRTFLLDSLARLHQEHGHDIYRHYTNLCNEARVDHDLLLNNALLLKQLGYLEEPATGSFQITFLGLEKVEAWRDRVSLVDEFEQISALEPKARGRALQKFLARTIEHSGWSQEEGVRSSHEEMDIIIYREREYYLVECKWEKDPIEASVIREVFGKLSNRVNVRGAVISLSGFTKGALGQVMDFAGQRIILLFGPSDVESLVYGRRSFEELLDEKYKELVTRRNAIYH